MRWPASWRRDVLTCLVLSLIVQVAALADVSIYLPGYSAGPFADAPFSGDDLAVDGAGRVYAPSANGITRFTPDGTGSPWSAAEGNALALAPDGTGYLATRSLSHSILRVATDGTSTTLVPTSSGLEWTWLAVSDDNRLYANVWAGNGEGLYSVDPVTGAVAQLVAGGPGTGGSGIYEGMVWGPDDHLYTVGHDGKNFGLFRLDGNSFTRLAFLPHAGIGLTFDPNGYFYTATNNAGTNQEVWRIDPRSGAAELLASGLGEPAGIAYDVTTNRLFVRDQLDPFHITAITVPEPGAAGIVVGVLLVLLLRRHQHAAAPAE